MPFIHNFRFAPPWSIPGEYCPGVDNCPSVILIKEATAKKLRQGQEALAQERQRLAAQKEELLALAEQLAQKKEALEKREQVLQTAEDRRAAVLQEAADRYQWERSRWEAARPMPEQESDLKAQVDTVKGAFLGIHGQLQEAKEKLVALIRAVDCQDQDGVAALCALYREMCLSEDPLAVKLGEILQSRFQAVALEPCPGDVYDPTCHERVNAARQGMTVSCCRARGWSRMGAVLLRAVVETEERSLFV